MATEKFTINFDRFKEAINNQSVIVIVTAMGKVYIFHPDRMVMNHWEYLGGWINGQCVAINYNPDTAQGTIDFDPDNPEDEDEEQKEHDDDF